MSRITKEWLQQAINDYESVRDELPFGLDDYQGKILAALRIALASIEAEPVAACQHQWKFGGANKLQSQMQCIKCGRVELTDTPVPVSVPDELTREEYKRRFMEDDEFDDTFRGGWSACRAAMLQGDENAESRCTMQTAPALDSLPKIAESRCSNSPVIPDGWVACSERMPEREIDVQVYCSDKKEQMVGYMERNERDGYFRFASLPNGGGVYCQPTHWMPLPAAPQQEVK